MVVGLPECGWYSHPWVFNLRDQAKAKNLALVQNRPPRRDYFEGAHSLEFHFGVSLGCQSGPLQNRTAFGRTNPKECKGMQN